MHVLILGMTESGKTTLAKRLATGYSKRGVGIIVLDPLNDDWPQADLQFNNNTEFLTACKSSKSCALFIDESGQQVGRYAREMAWVATQSRHWGHSAHFIAQRASMIDKTVRDQCGHLYIFRVSKKDAETLADEFTDDSLLDAARLDKLHYISVSRFGKSRKGSVKFKKSNK